MSGGEQDGFTDIVLSITPVRTYPLTAHIKKQSESGEERKFTAFNGEVAGSSPASGFGWSSSAG